MNRIITTKCTRRAQQNDDDTITTFVGGSIQEEDGPHSGFISHLSDLGYDVKVEITEKDPIIIIPGCDSINHIYLDDEFMILIGTKDGGKPYASTLKFNDNHTADITPFNILSDISVMRKTIPFHIDNTAYVSIGDKEFDNNIITSVVSLFDKELNQKKTITTTDATSGEALLVSLYDIIVAGENIFAGGVTHPTEEKNPLGIIIKLDKELNMINHSIISGSKSEATIVRAFDIIDGTLIALIEVRNPDETPGVLLKKFDMDLREVADQDEPADSAIPDTMGTVQ